MVSRIMVALVLNLEKYQFLKFLDNGKYVDLIDPGALNAQVLLSVPLNVNSVSCGQHLFS